MRKSRKSEFGRGYFDGKFTHFTQMYYLNNDEYVEAKKSIAVKAANEILPAWRRIREYSHFNSLDDAYTEGYEIGYQSWTDETLPEVLKEVMANANKENKMLSLALRYISDAKRCITYTEKEKQEMDEVMRFLRVMKEKNN